jgi:SAM-dependent methyltransferase
MTQVEQISPANAEAIDAWDGVLFDRFVKFRDVIVNGLGAHGDEALRLHPPRAGDRVLDIGCGFGDTTLRLAEMVGPTGTTVGVDAAARFIQAAREDAAEEGASNVRFDVVDVETAAFEEEFDYAFSRFGTMFFANPVAALRNVRRALVPGGRLCMVVWRRKLENEWLHRAEIVVKELVEKPEESDEPTCGPGPFSMADADTMSDILMRAGFEAISLERCDLDMTIGRDLDAAVEMVTALGPAGEVIRLAGEVAERMRPQIDAALRQELAAFEGPDGVSARSSTWIVTASAAGG